MNALVDIKGLNKYCYRISDINFFCGLCNPLHSVGIVVIKYYFRHELLIESRRDLGRVRSYA